MATANPALPRLVTEHGDSHPPVTLTQMAWQRFRRHKMAMFGLALLVLLVVYVVGGSFVVSEKYANYNDIAIKLLAPSARYRASMGAGSTLF